MKLHGTNQSKYFPHSAVSDLKIDWGNKMLIYGFLIVRREDVEGLRQSIDLIVSVKIKMMFTNVYRLQKRIHIAYSDVSGHFSLTFTSKRVGSK